MTKKSLIGTMALAAMFVGCQSEPGNDKGPESPDPEDGALDSWRSPTSHGDLIWGVDNAAELDGNARSYKVAAHRHVPEINQEASLAAGEQTGVTFIPYLIPATRGIVTSVLMRPKSALAAEDAHGLLAKAYADEPFVRVLPPGETPALQSVNGSNFCDVGVAVDPGNGAIVALSAIDNLVKGSGGQAVQCLNIMQGWSETAGLLEAPLLP